MDNYINHGGDLKNYEAPRFYLFTPEEAGKLIGVLVVVALLLDLFGVFAR